MPNRLQWKIRRIGETEFVCQAWCPRLAEAEVAWPYTSSANGPLAMRHNLQRREVDRGHTALTRLQECPTCITAVLDAPLIELLDMQGQP